ncbi:glycerol-3-phosphate 1-O-acyltransferase PlsY [Calycomorphotria hydatis]|uniref:Glycerol-3-phosphate acyltransferase n=1 Tax=Calycomorphotria hydatis TaxID=2528027 RepID=A0A517TEM8_9PLAN|nr:glycerol-3-phosphate 1-O-acyltransferase PlsY [Calycomorphotria hydatis]QDT66830.1 Glycerol-3-phosphate acyltransferase [Calycomorphotria hydatis]
MPLPVALLIAAVVAYLVGSLTFGLWIARAVKGIDIREHGSGNIGATNVGRVLGAKWGIICLVLDALKGLLPTLLLPRLLISDPEMLQHATVLCGLAAIVGHIFPVWLKFHGGKGVATAAGVAGVISWPSLLAGAIVFGLTFGITRIVSLASMLAAVTYAVTTFVVLAAPFSAANWSMTAFSLAVAVLIIARHRSNISRLLSGNEAKLTDPAGPIATEPDSEQQKPEEESVS